MSSATQTNVKQSTTGTTNTDTPFVAGERIRYAGEIFIVVENYGRSGKVREPGRDRVVCSGFYWNLDGEEAVRDEGVLV